MPNPQFELPFTEPPGAWGSGWWRWPSTDPELKIVAASNTPSHPKLGHDAGTLAGVGSIGVPLVGETARGR